MWGQLWTEMQTQIKAKYVRSKPQDKPAFCSMEGKESEGKNQSHPDELGVAGEYAQERVSCLWNRLSGLTILCNL